MAILFQANEKYYPKIWKSYTSNDEFYLNRHIWENNELPSVDPYDMSHSLLHDDLWKWLLGSTSMAYDIPFNFDTEAEEYFDSDGIITHPSIAKYVNGVRAFNYGPLPYYHFERDQSQENGGLTNYDEEKYARYGAPAYIERKYTLKEDLSGPALEYKPGQWIYRPVWPSYTRYEVNGTVAPEFDFLLHEGYRYLKNLYPDHPDYEVLLTNNEINDEFNQISTFMNYPINCQFFDWLVQHLEYDPSIDESVLFDLYRQEALKLKYRNLIQHTFRKKLFGAKTGYWMFGSEALQHTTVYPVAEYLPLRPLPEAEKEEYVRGMESTLPLSTTTSGQISGEYYGYISGDFSNGNIKIDISGYLRDDNEYPSIEYTSGTSYSGIFQGALSGFVSGEFNGILSGYLSGYLSGIYNGERVPSVQVTKEFYNFEANNDYKWYRKLFRAPNLFKEKEVNYEDTLYRHPYRLMDFSNNSYELKERYQPAVKIWGTAYPSPLSSYDLYEYPVERDIFIPLTMQEDFYEGQKVWIGDRELDGDENLRENKTPAYINAMFYEDSYDVSISLDYSSGILANSSLFTRINEDVISHIQVTAPVYPIYQDFKIYPSIEEMLKLVLTQQKNDPYGNYESFNSYTNATNFYDKFIALDTIISGYHLPYYKDGQIAIDIHQNGNIFLPAQHFLSLYQDDLEIKIERPLLEKPLIKYFGTGINETDGFIKAEDLLVKETSLFTGGASDIDENTSPDGKAFFISEICGLEGGRLKILITKPYLLTKSQKETLEDQINSYTEAQLGIILRFSLNNQDSYNKKVVLFGRPVFTLNERNENISFVGPDYNGMYYLNSFDFIISSIPRIKSNNMLKFIYNDFHSIASQKVADLRTIFGDDNELEDNNFFKKYYTNEALQMLINYDNFKNNLNTIFKKFDKENECRKEVSKVLNIFTDFFNYPDYSDPENKYQNLLSEVSTYNEYLDKQLIISGDKTSFEILNVNFISLLKEYQEKFHYDILNYRFPIKDSVDGMENQINLILPEIKNIWDIIQNKDATDNYIIEEHYNKFYEFYNTFVDFFNYSSSPGGLQEDVLKLLPEFKLRADNEIFAVKIQNIVHNLYTTLEALKIEVKEHFDIIDHGGEPPYPILKGENYLNFLEYSKQYKESYASYDNYESVVKEINDYQHEIYNAVNPMYPRSFDQHADNYNKKVEEIRAPFVQEPIEYTEFCANFMREINKFYHIFLEDLVDMPELIEDKIVRFPIEATMRELSALIEKFKEAFNDEADFWNQTLEFANIILSHFKYENEIRTFHFTDINDNVNEIKRQITSHFTNFENITSPISINDESYNEKRNLIINQFNSYITFYNDRLKYMIATDLEKSYYAEENLDTKSFTADQKSAISSIKAIDEKISEYLPNRGMLLKPLPDDIYMNVTSELLHSYSLLNNQDSYLGIFKYIFDEYNTFLTYNYIKEYNNEGIMEDYFPGTVNTAELVHRDMDIQSDTYISGVSGEEIIPGNISRTVYNSKVNYIREYNLDSEFGNSGYLTLNKDIITVNKLSDNDKNFSFCDNEWLELFLPENKKENIEGEIPKKYEVEIRSIITKDSTQIEFVDEMSKSRIYALTTGDQIIGPNIEDDTRIVSIDLFNFLIQTNKPLNITADLVLTYLTKYNLSPEEFNSNNFFDYRINLAKSAKTGGPSLVNTGSILENGLSLSEPFMSNVSQHYVNGYIDVSKYRQDLLSNLQSQEEYRKHFNNIVKTIHNGGKSLESHYTMPSIINYYGSTYFEVNAHRLYDKDGEQYLMIKDILDYFQDYLDDLSRASDKVNIGVNVMIAGDNSQSIIEDKDVGIEFITTEPWGSESSRPTYIELGTGNLFAKSSSPFSSKEDEEPQVGSSNEKFYYNWDLYNGKPANSTSGAVSLEEENESLTHSGLASQGVTLENETGGMWGTLEIESKADALVSFINHVDVPVLTYKLGEYEVQRAIRFNNYTDPNKKWTTVQFSVIKQSFKNLLITGQPVKQFTKNFLDLKIFLNPSANYYNYSVDNQNIILINETSDLLNSVCRGEWIPSYYTDELGKKIINYPAPEAGEGLFYWSIGQSKTLTGVYNPTTELIETVDYKFGTILVWENSKWILKGFSFAGLIGDISKLSIEPFNPDDTENPPDPLIANPIVPSKVVSLKESLMIKMLRSLGVAGMGSPEQETSYDENDLTTIFQIICGKYRTREEAQQFLNTKEIDISTLPLIENVNDFYPRFNISSSNEEDWDPIRNRNPANEIFWFYSLPPTYEWIAPLSKIVENPLMFGLYYSVEDEQFYLYLLNFSRMFYLIDHSRKTNILENEWNTFIGKWGPTKNKLLPWEKIDQYQNTLQLPYTNLIQGSVNINWKLMPHFMVSGYLYDSITNKPNLLTHNNYDITQDNIYYDETNNYLYSYNNNKKDKFAIIAENNKYFKNLLYLYCNYDTELFTQGTNIIERGKLTAIPNVNFESSLTSLKDRLLEIEQINVRSQYNINLESTQFSNYLNLTGEIKGIYISGYESGNVSLSQYVSGISGIFGGDLYLNVGYADRREPKATGERLSYASELNKIFPMRYNAETETNEAYPAQVIDFSADSFENNFDLLPPTIQHSEIYGDIGGGDRVFSFYKNTLLLEGKIDISDPGYIDFTDNPMLGDALSKVSVGDKIVGIVGLNNLKEKSYHLYEIYNLGITDYENWSRFSVEENTGRSLEIPKKEEARRSDIMLKFLDYNNGYLIGASDTQYFIYPCKDLLSLANRTYGGNSVYDIIAAEKSLGEVSEIIDNTTINAIIGQLVSLVYNQDDKRWYFTLSDTTGSSSQVWSLEIEKSTHKPIWKLAYNTLGYDINTYQRIEIMDEQYMDSQLSGNYNKKIDVYARDISFDYISGIINDDIIVSQDDISWESGVSGIVRYIGNSELINDITLQHGIGIEVNDDTTENRVLNVGPPISLRRDDGNIIDYKKVSFVLGKTSTSGGHSISFGIPGNDAGLSPNSASVEMWTYNYRTSMWEVSRNTDVFGNFVTEFDAPGQYIPVCLYIVSEQFLHEDPNNSSEFVLQHLPVPGPNTAALVLKQNLYNDHTIQLQATIKNNIGNTEFRIYEFRIEEPKFITSGFTYTENPYNPLIEHKYINQKYDQFVSKKWSAYYNDYQAVIMGNTLFIKSPTKLAADVPISERNAILYNPEYHNSTPEYSPNVSLKYHWKRAELPEAVDVTYSLLNEMELQQAYDWVKTQYDRVVLNLNEVLAQSNDDKTDALKALSQFLNIDKTLNDQTYKGPWKFVTDEELPTDIYEHYVKFTLTEKGHIPYFNFELDTTGENNQGVKVFETWKSTQDSKFELGNIIDVYLKRQNYLRYLADYASAILGAARFEPFFSAGNIIDVTFSNKALIIHTKYYDILSLDLQYLTTRDDIENYNNWNISNIDDDYLFVSEPIHSTRIIGYKIDGKDIYKTVDSLDSYVPEKAFKILNKYIENNISIYCGYIQATPAALTYYEGLNNVSPESRDTDMINNMLSLFPNNSATINESVQATIYNTKYPAIYYSTDNINFSKVFLPTQAFVTSLDGYDESTKHLEAVSIVREGNEIRVWLREDSESVDQLAGYMGYTSFNIGIFGDTNTLTYLSTITEMPTLNSVQDHAARELKNLFLNSLNTIIVGKVEQNTHIVSPLEDTGSSSNRFLINKQYSPVIDNSLVSAVEDFAVRYTPAISESTVSEILSVLVSIDSSRLISNQSLYIGYNDKYFDSVTNGYKVPEYVEVTDTSTANRMYSRRECLTVRPDTDINYNFRYPRENNSDGMPAISEDINHRIYEYYDSFTNNAGIETWKYREATNREGDYIYLCNERGEYLAQLDPISVNQIYNIKTIIENNIPISQLARAPIVRPDYSPIILDKEFTTLMNLLPSKEIRYINFTGANPQLYIYIDDINVRKDFNDDGIEEQSFVSHLSNYSNLADGNPLDDYFYSWPVNSDTGELYSLQELDVTENYGNTEVMDNDPRADFILLKNRIEENEGRFENSEGRRFRDRLIPYLIETESNEEEFITDPNTLEEIRVGFKKVLKAYIFDLKTKTLLVKHKRTIINNFNVPYLFNAGIQIFTNKGFTKEGDFTLLSPNLTYPITGVYIPFGGYGGYLGNTSWLERPDEIDYKAWDHTKFLKNQNDENIFMSDYRGNKLSIKHGLFYLKTYEKATISYANLAFEGLNTFNVSKDIGEENIISTYNAYKVIPSLPQIYSPKDDIFFNHCYSYTDEFGTYTDPHDSDKENLLALIKIIKDGVEITDFSGYTFSILDYENKTPILRSRDDSGSIKKGDIILDNNCKFKVSKPSSNEWPDSLFIIYEWNHLGDENKYTQKPSVDGDILKLVVTDNYGQVVEKEFSVKIALNNLQEELAEPLRIMAISPSYIFDNAYVNNDYTTISFYNNSIIDQNVGDAGVELKSEDPTIVPNEFGIRKSTETGVQFVEQILSFREILTSSRVFYYSNLFTFNLDLRHYNIKFYLKKNWTKKSFDTLNTSDIIKEEFSIKIYSGDNDITDVEIINAGQEKKLTEFSILNNNIVAVVGGQVRLYQPITLKTDTEISEVIELGDKYLQYIYMKNSDEFELGNLDSDILIDGLYGQVLLKVPTCASFKDLLDIYETIIEYRVRRIINTINPILKEEFNRFVEIQNGGSAIVLENLITYDKIIPGGKNYLKIKILPVNSIYPSLKTANSLDYIWEVTQKETEVYGLDRIWINELSYPLPPTMVNRVLYNSENIPFYYENTWRNKDNFSIFSCNNKGQYVKFVPVGGKLDPRVIGLSNGDLRNDIFGSIDPRHNPLEPIYKSSLDWFLSEYYIKGKESNPFIIELNLTEEIKNQKYNQIVNITQKTKLDNDFINKKVTDSYISQVINNLEYSIDRTTNSIIQRDLVDFIDYTNGIINFSIIQPNLNYRENRKLFLFGINYYNQYYYYEQEPALRNVWFSVANIDNKIDMSFDIYSFENYLDKRNRDYAVKWFTEVGIFDQDGRMMAYAHHPKVEYRTDSQHISYTFIVNESDN